MEKISIEHEFLIEEYKTLRMEIQKAIDHTRKIIYFNIVCIGVIWSFVLTENIKVDLIIKWLPLLIAIISSAYRYSISRDVKRIGDYINLVEKKLLKSYSNLGWEKHLRKENIGWISKSDHWEIFFWIIIFLTTLIGPLII